MEVLKFLLIYGGVVTLLIPFFSWLVHVLMVTGDGCKQYGFATFKRFLVEFDKYSDKTIEVGGKTSLFVYEKKYERLVYIHASIIRFGDNGMILYPIDWWKFKFWLKKYTSNKVEKLWK